jgi:hypothetical protein
MLATPTTAAARVGASTKIAGPVSGTAALNLGRTTAQHVKQEAAGKS